MKRTYSIGDVAQMTRITTKQIRHWEDRNFLTDVQRVVCGIRSYRVYTLEQVEFIRRMKFYLDQGYTLPTSAQKAKIDFEGGQTVDTDHN